MGDEEGAVRLMEIQRGGGGPFVVDTDLVVCWGDCWDVVDGEGAAFGDGDDCWVGCHLRVEEIVEDVLEARWLLWICSRVVVVLEVA